MSDLFPFVECSVCAAIARESRTASLSEVDKGLVDIYPRSPVRRCPRCDTWYAVHWELGFHALNSYGPFLSRVSTIRAHEWLTHDELPPASRKDRRASLRDRACARLLRGRRALLTGMRELLSSPHAELRAHAAETLADACPPSAIAKLLDNPDVATRLGVLRTFSYFGKRRTRKAPASIVPRLVEILCEQSSRHPSHQARAERLTDLDKALRQTLWDVLARYLMALATRADSTSKLIAALAWPDDEFASLAMNQVCVWCWKDRARAETVTTRLHALPEDRRMPAMTRFLAIKEPWEVAYNDDGD